MFFYNGSAYDYHFIIKKLAKEFKIQFESLGANTEKCITFSVPINKKITKMDKSGNVKIVNIPCKLKFIGSFRFISTSLSSFVDKLSDGLHSNKCTDCKSSLHYMKVEGSQLIFKCLNCNKNCNKDFNKGLINRFSSTYKFCEENINKCILLLRKGVYPYESMDTGKDLMKHHYLI